MDNKQDKQFYWEVKDFLNKKPSTTQKKAKPESLKESIQKMLVSQNKLHTPQVLTEDSNKQMANELSCFSEDLIKNVNSLLSMNEEAVNKGTPECKAFTPNIVDNMFNLKKNLNEALLNPEILTKPGRKNNILSPRTQDQNLNREMGLYASSMQFSPSMNRFQSLPSYALTPPPADLTPAEVRFIGPQSSMPAAQLSYEQGEMMKDLRTARAQQVPSYNPRDPGSLEAVRSARQQRNEKIATANIAIRGELDRTKAELRKARESGDANAVRELTLTIRKMNDEMNPETPQMGSSSQAAIGSRYSERSSPVPPAPPKLETMGEILAGPAVGKKPVRPTLAQMKNQVPR